MCEFITSLGTSAVYDLCKNTFLGCLRHVNRLCHYATYKRNVKILIEQLDILEKHRGEVIAMVDEKVDDEIHHSVIEWLNETKNALSENRAMAKHASQNFSDFMFHPRVMIDEITLSRITTTINEMIKRYIEFNGRISYPSRFYDKDYISFKGRRSVLEGVIDALKNRNVKMIGLHGMGGIGKTTLAKEIARQAKKEANLFDKVIMGSAISQTPNYENIQCEIAKDLGVEFGYHETKLTKAIKLREELSKQEKVLIILDDIWQKIDLFDIGIHFNDDQIGCKILFTSRCQGLYSPVVEFALDSLQEDESTKLFTKIVDKTLDENPDCRPLLSELVKECGGVPIVINTVAAALKDAPSSKWRTFLHEMRNTASENIDGMDSKVFQSIKMSYYYLESEEAKSLLLLCSTYSEDELISDNDLLMYGVGWPLLMNANTLEAGRDKLHTLIDMLRKNCLLLPSDESNSNIYYHWVRLHDVIRDVLKPIASEKGWFSVSEYAKLPEEMNKGLLVESLLIDIRTELPNILACPKLVSLIDTTFHEKRLSEFFFEETRKLKVLKLYRVDLRSPPSSFCCLFESLQTLCLNNCDLEDTTFLGGFKNLKCLNLSKSKFEILSRQVGQLTLLKLLNLDFCEKLRVIEPNVISSLINLEELYMRNVCKVWEVEKVRNQRSRASLAELKNLPRLNTLYLEIDNDNLLPKDFITSKMTRYQIMVGPSFNFMQKENISHSRVLKLELHNANLMNENGLNKLMKECQALQLKGCEDTTIDICISSADGFPELEIFDLHDAPNVEYLVSSALMYCNRPVFRNLENMVLTKLEKLRKICDGELVADSFGKLKNVAVSECHTLKSMFPASNIVGQLEEMKVEYCDMMENIVFHRRKNGTSQKIEFLKLQKLYLCELPKLIQFSTVQWEPNFTTSSSMDSLPNSNALSFFMEEVVAFPVLEELDLSSLESIEMIWPYQLKEVSYMQNLKDLTVEECEKLKYVFSSSVAKSLVQLRNLKVECCENMQEILVKKEGSLKETILFPKLEWLKLYSLPNLKSFSVGQYLAIEFPSLKMLEIWECGELKTFHQSCTNEIEKPERPLIDEEVVAFPILEQLDLSSLVSLGMIWPDQPREVSYLHNLKDINISHGHKLKYLFSSTVARNLAQLKNLRVEYCKNMQEILATKEEEEEGEEGSMNETILFPKLEEVTLLLLSNLKRFSGGKHLTIECPSLKMLDIDSCSKMKTFQKSCSNEIEKPDEPLFNRKITFPTMEKFFLESHDSIEIIWPDQLQDVSYMQNLEDLKVAKCEKLKYLFSSAMARALVHLKKLSIEKCENIEEILVIKEAREEESQIEELQLDDHPHLRNFNVEQYLAIECPSLEILDISICPKLKMFIKTCTTEIEEQSVKVVPPILEEMNLKCLFMPSNVSFRNLKEIKIIKCSAIINLMNSSTVKSLVQLQKMTISQCDQFNQVIVDDEAGDMVFPQLKALMLHRLPKLKSFNCGNSDIQFPNLEKVIVIECPCMENFSGGNVITSKLDKVITKLAMLASIYNVDSCKGVEDVWKGDIKTSVRMIWEKVTQRYA
ncbi:hypothetical protein G4B88_005064 [Cannabis sativa]|uniref:AAA+ ATPase domain-containing protein n=1 Tax=Cannabis sativa TaxID=3483 RepID=A0A7J6H4F1_CANSA|nr:hypothetical protein G4B88_005064 [Cannabis sativa]